MEKKLLLGDEAIALGAIHAGLSGVYASPGTPSTEITEFIQGNALAKERGIHSRWCTNEKTAMEAALGMSYMGKRAMVCMKHVGMNVCADAFVNSAMTGTNGGLVVVAADDPRVLTHDATLADPTLHRMLALMGQERYMEAGGAETESELPIALGVIRNVAEETYDHAVNQQIADVQAKSKIHTFDELLGTLEQWEA